MKLDPLRETAARAGKKQYASGRPCVKNPAHGDVRFTTSDGCVECNRERNRARHETIKALMAQAEKGEQR